MPFVLGTLLAASLALTGCEDTESTDTPVKITPSSTALRKGESVTLTASGGFEYKWAMEQDKLDWGFLSAYEGETVVYTSLYDPPSQSAVHVITVTSTYPSAYRADALTNAPPVDGGKTAEAYITHLSPSNSVPST